MTKALTTKNVVAVLLAGVMVFGFAFAFAKTADSSYEAATPASPYASV